MSKFAIILIVISSIAGAGYLLLRNSQEVEPVATKQQNGISRQNNDLEFEAPCGYTSTIGQGPYYVSGAPILTDGNLNYTAQPGQSLVLSGYVLDGIENPIPIAGAEVDMWQTDANGDYHPLGAGSVDDYNMNEIELRGIVTTNESGQYEVTTILPEEYPGRPRHIHVKVRAPGKPELTTQLYWQLDGDQNLIGNSDVDENSRDCQILSVSEAEEVYSSEYSFYLR